MRIIRKIGAAFLTLFVIPLFVLASCNSALNAAVFNPQTYQEAFDDPQLFDDLLNVALPAILEGAEESTPGGIGFEDSPVSLGELSTRLDEDTWREVTTLLIPPDWLQSRADQLVQGISDVVIGDYEGLDASFELEVVQDRFEGEEAARAAAIIISEAPVCTAPEEERLSNFLVSGAGTLPICKPGDPNIQQRSINSLTTWFNGIGAALRENAPTTAAFFDFNRSDARQITLLAEMNQQILLLMYLCPGALLALVVVLAVRSLGGFARWVGVTLLVTGTLLLVSLLMLQGTVISAFGDLLAPVSEIQAFGTRLLLPVLREGLAQASGSLLVQSILFVGIGFAILAYAWLEGRGEPVQQHDSGEYVLLTTDGRLISSSTQREIGTLTPSDIGKDQP